MEQTETPEQLETRRKEKGSKDTVCSILYKFVKMVYYLSCIFLFVSCPCHMWNFLGHLAPCCFMVLHILQNRVLFEFLILKFGIYGGGSF